MDINERAQWNVSETLTELCDQLFIRRRAWRPHPPTDPPPTPEAFKMRLWLKDDFRSSIAFHKPPKYFKEQQQTQTTTTLFDWPLDWMESLGMYFVYLATAAESFLIPNSVLWKSFTATTRARFIGLRVASIQWDRQSH